MKVGIIGGTGKMGGFFAGVFKRAGHDVLICGRNTRVTCRDLAQECHLVMVSVPIRDTVRVPSTPPRHPARQGIEGGLHADLDRALQDGFPDLARLGEQVQPLLADRGAGIAADGGDERRVVEALARVVQVDDDESGVGRGGGEGAADVARAVVKICEEGKSKLKLLYPDEMPLFEKVRTIAREIYRARDVTADKAVKDQLKQWEEMGYGKLPVCIAKTQYSFSTNADAKGAPNIKKRNPAAEITTAVRVLTLLLVDRSHQPRATNTVPSENIWKE